MDKHQTQRYRFSKCLVVPSYDVMRKVSYISTFFNNAITTIQKTTLPSMISDSIAVVTQLKKKSVGHGVQVAPSGCVFGIILVGHDGSGCENARHGTVVAPPCCVLGKNTTLGEGYLGL